VEVAGFDANGKSLGAGKSKSAFTIKVVKLTSPGRGETWKSGSKQAITWTTYATVNPVAKTILSYSEDNGVTWKPITSLTGNLGTYTWTVPAESKAKTKCKVKAVLEDAHGKTVGSDTNVNDFAIQR
jgi:hypothetical protein